MAVSNFYLEAFIDGRLHPLSAGPRNRRGGFQARIKVRHRGSSSLAFTIQGWVPSDDPNSLKLTVLAHTPDGVKEVARVTSSR